MRTSTRTLATIGTAALAALLLTSVTAAARPAAAAAAGTGPVITEPVLGGPAESAPAGADRADAGAGGTGGAAAPADPAALGEPRDARAAARAEGARTGDVGTQASWQTGTVAPGGTQHWIWNNANPLSAAYNVGFLPSGVASKDEPCMFEVIENWYQQQVGGERKFHLVIQNAGTIACKATVLLSWVDGINIGRATMAPGEWQHWWWNNSNPDLAHLIGLSPVGATGQGPCQFEVIRSWYWEQSSQELEFHLNFRNNGPVTCSADVHLAFVPKTDTFQPFPGWLAPGHSITWSRRIDSSVTHVVGLSNIGGSCELQVVRSWSEEIVTGGTSRWFVYRIRNVGLGTCSHFMVIGLAVIPA